VLALAASPLRVVVHPGAAATISVRNLGAVATSVAAAPAAYRLDLRGRPVLGPAGRRWLVVSSARLVLAPGRSATLVVRALAPRGARPGDHAQVLLLSAATLGRGGLRLAVRVGVVVVVRCPGVLRRRLTPLGLTVQRGSRLRLALRNDGNVDEWIGARRVAVRVWRGARLLVVLRAHPRRLLAGAQGVFDWRLRDRRSGPVRAAVTVDQRVERRYWLRL